MYIVLYIWVEMTEPHSYTLFNLVTNSNTLLQPTTEQKDLGVWNTPSMNFSVHCQKAASKANQALGKIKRNFKYMSKVPLLGLSLYYALEITDYALKQCSKFLPIYPIMLLKNKVAITVLQSLTRHLGSTSYQASD